MRGSGGPLRRNWARELDDPNLVFEAGFGVLYSPTVQRAFRLVGTKLKELERLRQEEGGALLPGRLQGGGDGVSCAAPECVLTTGGDEGLVVIIVFGVFCASLVVFVIVTWEVLCKNAAASGECEEVHLCVVNLSVSRTIQLGVGVGFGCWPCGSLKCRHQ